MNKQISGVIEWLLYYYTVIVIYLCLCASLDYICFNKNNDSDGNNNKDEDTFGKKTMIFLSVSPLCMLLQDCAM